MITREIVWRRRAPAVPSGGIVTLVDRNFGYFSLRSATLFLIAGLHAALFFGLITSLSHTHKAAVPPDLLNRNVPSVPPDQSTCCSRRGFESLDDYRAETGGGIAAPAGYRTR